MIAIVNYEMGNLKSVKKALEFVGAKVEVTSRIDKIKESRAIILPGVGAFKEAMKNLNNLKIIPTLKEEIKKGKPILGICLGLQLLFTESEEGGLYKGLDVINGRIRGFKNSYRCHFKIPHMGWNTIKIKNRKMPDILENIPDNSYFYFVHSYYGKTDNKEIVIATTDYGVKFLSVIGINNVYGVQFHPEKSGESGLKILDNFYQLTKNS